MKLKSKQTGEIMEFDAVLVAKDIKGNEVAHLEYNSIDKFLEEWEDVPEPKGIKSVGNIGSSVHIELGSKEEAEKAVERLSAWKRLKDEGFRFSNWKGQNGTKLIFPDGSHKSSICDDLDLLFSGEDD